MRKSVSRRQSAAIRAAGRSELCLKVAALAGSRYHRASPKKGHDYAELASRKLVYRFGW